MTTIHSKYSPSSSNRWLNCPGSLTIDSPNAIQLVNEYAVFGTIVHELVERWGNTQILPENQVWIDDIEVPSGGFIQNTPQPVKLPTPITKEHLTAANECIDYLISVGVDINTMYELKVEFEEYAPGGYGTCDIVMINAETKIVDVIDVKTGQIRVNAKDNSQMMIYALGTMLKFTLPDEYKYRLTILQPKLHNYDQFMVTTAELLAFGETIKVAVVESLKPNPKRVIGNWCTFCPNLTTCNEYKGFIDSLFDNMDSGIDNDIDFNIKVIKLKGTLVNYVNGLEQKVFNSLSNGELDYSKQFKLDRTVTKRAWTNEADKVLSKSFGDDCYTKKLIGITEATKLLAMRFDRKEAIKMVDQITIRPEGALVLKLIDDDNVVENNFFNDLGE